MKVSVVIPTYNNSHYIKDALNSVLSQTIKPYEIIVVDDGSTDDTNNIVTKQYRSLVKYIFQANSGVSSARNVGIADAQGDYVALLDSDDIYEPTFLEECLSFFNCSPNLGIIFTDCIVFNNVGIISQSICKNSKMYKVPYESFGSSRRLFRRRLIKELMWGSFISNSSVVVKSSVFKRVGLYDVALSTCEDRHFWIRADKEFMIGYIDKPLGRIRRHDRNLTEPSNALRASLNGILVLQDINNLIRMSLLEKLHYFLSLSSNHNNIAWLYKEKQDFVKSLRHYISAIKYNPLNLSALINMIKLPIFRIKSYLALIFGDRA